MKGARIQQKRVEYVMSECTARLPFNYLVKLLFQLYTPLSILCGDKKLNFNTVSNKVQKILTKKQNKNPTLT